MMTATVFAAPGEATAIAAAAIALLFVGLWAVSTVIGDVSIVDPVWGPAFVVVAAACLIVGDAVTGEMCSRRWLLLALTAVWGLRLGGYLVARKLGDPGEDRRYGAMREKRGAGFVPYSLVVIFGLQGLLVMIVSLPIQVAAERTAPLDAVAIVGAALWLVGFAFEAIGDEQLRRFKARPGSKGQVMDRGLWRYTRHPNYFGDFCVWWGLWLVAVGAGGTWWTFVGAAVMSFLLIKGSGAALLEKDIGQRRPQYAEYIRRTSRVLPAPAAQVGARSRSNGPAQRRTARSRISSGSSGSVPRAAPSATRQTRTCRRTPRARALASKTQSVTSVKPRRPRSSSAVSISVRPIPPRHTPGST